MHKFKNGVRLMLDCIDAYHYSEMGGTTKLYLSNGHILLVTETPEEIDKLQIKRMWDKHKAHGPG